MEEQDLKEGPAATGGHLRRPPVSPHPVRTLVRDVAVLLLPEPGRMLTGRTTLDHALDAHRLERPSVLDRSVERVATVRTVEFQHDVLVGPAAALRALLSALEVGDGKRVIALSSRQVFKLSHLSGLAEDPPPNVEIRPPGCVPLGSGF
jgi:hypothetical protein